ncbi:MAG TPA: Crp/Fnr family transcriptional regulator [Candidatus Eisenbacteria bacterium]|nr:Crp/Fnr family transcriptional regulator [Candidatus Eisenbacteria bacterium]
MAQITAPSRAPSVSGWELLSKVAFFADAPPELQREIAQSASVVRLAAGAYFLREGDTCGHFAVVVSGRMRVFKLGESGHEITLYHVGAGEACPLNVSCILSDRPVPAMARVEEDVEAVVMPAASFRRWVASHESLRSVIFEMFSTRLTEVMSLVEEVAFRRMDQRLAKRLIELFQAHGDETVETTHADIAADLGTAREVVSRLLKEFERLGAIGLARGRIELVDGALLRGMAGRE